jgi:predicted CXXCH cytochrome family protein
VRRRLWHSHRGFQAAHVIVACVTLFLIVAHVAVTSRYLGGWGRRLLFGAAAAGAVLMLLRSRRLAPPALEAAAAESAAPRVRRQWVFGRHSTLIVGAVIACAVAIAALVPAQVDATLREPLVRRANALPLDFPHDKHGAVNCLTCHHNYSDGSGMEACVQCHRSNRADLKEGVEAQFHGFCFECHRHPDAAFHRHGPVSGCTICHRTPAPGSQGPVASPAAD